MIPYGNAAGNSGVVAYQIGKDYIAVKFVDRDEPYIYSHASAGAQHVKEMKKLAKAGQGLSTYISQHVKDGYER
ncbi:hypothetical protein [Mucilaginibacter boryungensis]|uniref:KTSC domain-containing protein n=1 Tax=Mucilaginibacter boryungensis TaxID=768480 RepID=A0ABR9XKU9_9SPHI|nr:hypothetical protein [Mucilaginibacter boryungensis]MBE9668012.1 hypothetical protein [Mucilaginibacter boryungensis]